MMEAEASVMAMMDWMWGEKGRWHLLFATYWGKKYEKRMIFGIRLTEFKVSLSIQVEILIAILIAIWHKTHKDVFGT